MECPGSLRLCESLPSQDTTNDASREGTFAHSVAETLATMRLGMVDVDTGQSALDAIEKQVAAYGFDFEEMWQHGSDWGYQALEMQRSGLTIALERRVSPGVPQSWGTADLAAWKPDYVYIKDFKYGKGVRVDAPGNPQLMMYGLGVLERFAPGAKHVEMAIWQPRIGHYSTETMTAEELRDWRDAVAIPAAKLALSPDAPIVPSDEACRFCPAAGVCEVRREVMLNRDFGEPAIMTPEKLAETLETLDGIEAWASAVRAASLQQAKTIDGLPGWKIVRKRGQRKITEPDKVIDLLGPTSVRHSLRPLGELEKLVGGKAKLAETLGDLLTFAQGSEVLAPESDPRPASSPGDDFNDDA